MQFEKVKLKKIIYILGNAYENLYKIFNNSSVCYSKLKSEYRFS